MKLIQKYYFTIDSSLHPNEIKPILVSVTEHRGEQGLLNANIFSLFKRNLKPLRGTIEENNFIVTMNRKNRHELLTIAGEITASENGSTIYITMSPPKYYFIRLALLSLIVMGGFLIIALIAGSYWFIVLIVPFIAYIFHYFFRTVLREDRDKAIELLKDVFHTSI